MPHYVQAAAADGVHGAVEPQAAAEACADAPEPAGHGNEDAAPATAQIQSQKQALPFVKAPTLSAPALSKRKATAAAPAPTLGSYKKLVVPSKPLAGAWQRNCMGNLSWLSIMCMQSHLWLFLTCLAAGALAANTNSLAAAHFYAGVSKASLPSAKPVLPSVSTTPAAATPIMKKPLVIGRATPAPSSITVAASAPPTSSIAPVLTRPALASSPKVTAAPKPAAPKVKAAPKAGTSKPETKVG